MFQGFCELAGSKVLDALVKTSADVPINADALPTYRVYGPEGFLSGQSGTMSFKDSGAITDATNASPIEIESVGHGLTTGTRVTITGVGGNSAANTTATITVVDPDHFTLDGTTGSGAYTSGGTWNVTGLYTLSLTVSAANGYEAGETYTVLLSYDISSTDFGQLLTFIVT